MTEGMAAAAPASGGTMRKAMGQAFRGMDEALTKSVEAGEEALRKLVATGRSISDNEVKQALDGPEEDRGGLPLDREPGGRVGERARGRSCATSRARRAPAPRPGARRRA